MSNITQTFQKLSTTESQDVEIIASQAENILRCCIFKLLEKVIEQESNNGQLDFTSIPAPVLNELNQINQYLAKCREADENNISDIIHNKILKIMDKHLEFTLYNHHKVFHKLAAELDLSNEFSLAYETFVNVCKQLMQDEITWFRVVALLCFGAEIAVTVIKNGGPGVQSFIERIVHYVVDFMLKEEVAEWIKDHGGWVSMVNLFDSEDCPHRAEHLISIMLVTESTLLDHWMKRIAFSLVVVGTAWLIGKSYFEPE